MTVTTLKGDPPGRAPLPPAAPSTPAPAAVKGATPGSSGDGESRHVPRDPPVRRPRLKPGEARIKILSALEMLANAGDWNRTDGRIADLARVPRPTYYRLSKVDELVKKVLAEFRKQRLGRRPADLEEI
jgi:hypothetical protein